MLLSPGRSTLRVVFHFLVADMPARICLSASVLVWSMPPNHLPAQNISPQQGLLQTNNQISTSMHTFRHGRQCSPS